MSHIKLHLIVPQKGLAAPLMPEPAPGDPWLAPPHNQALPPTLAATHGSHLDLRLNCSEATDTLNGLGSNPPGWGQSGRAPDTYGYAHLQVHAHRSRRGHGGKTRLREPVRGQDSLLLARGQRSV